MAALTLEALRKDLVRKRIVWTEDEVNGWTRITIADLKAEYIFRRDGTFCEQRVMKEEAAK